MLVELTEGRGNVALRRRPGGELLLPHSQWVWLVSPPAPAN